MARPATLMNRIWEILALKCPRCGQGRLFINRNPYRFRDMGQMFPQCPHCAQDFSIEPGFYYGAAMISYTLQVLIVVGMAFGIYAMEPSSRLFYFIPICTVLFVSSPYIVVLSRSIWLSFFVRPDAGVRAR